MKKVCCLIFFMSFWGLQAQDNLVNYLILGVEKAEDIIGNYVQPLSEGLMYGLTGGWFNSAVVNEKWQIDVDLKSNGSFIPEDKLSRTIDISAIDNLEVVGGGNFVEIPTILGESDSSVSLVATLDGREFEFEVPTGIGLVGLNLLPTAFLQVNAGMPYHSEVGFRFFPKISVGDLSVGIVGLGIQHQFSEWFNNAESSKFAYSFNTAFTSLSMDFKFDDGGGFVQGENQLIDGSLNSWFFQLSASTKFPIYNAYAGFGYIVGHSNYDLKGNYTIETDIRTVTFNDPLSIRNTVEGIRFNIGGMVRMGWFSVNLDYTFQGYNNVALGLNFVVFKPKASQPDPDTP